VVQQQVVENLVSQGFDQQAAEAGGQQAFEARP
jgi:hypothetical protein